MTNLTGNQIASIVCLTITILTLMCLGYWWYTIRGVKRKAEWDAYMAPIVYTPEMQEELDKKMDRTAQRAAEEMCREYAENKERYIRLYGEDLKWFVHIPLIPPYACIINVHPGQKSRHEDGGYQKLVMELYNKLKEDYDQKTGTRSPNT